MEYSTEQLLKFLSISNKKLKKLKSNIKNIRIERNNYKRKLYEIELYLNDIRDKFDRYDYPSESECNELEGKKLVKEDILNILKN